MTLEEAIAVVRDKIRPYFGQDDCFDEFDDALCTVLDAVEGGEWWIGRADGSEILGEFSWTGGGKGASPTWDGADADADSADEAVEYVARRMVCVEQRNRTLPECGWCDQPATHYGLCETHWYASGDEEFTPDPARSHNGSYPRNQDDGGEG